MFILVKWLVCGKEGKIKDTIISDFIYLCILLKCLECGKGNKVNADIISDYIYLKMAAIFQIGFIFKRATLICRNRKEVKSCYYFRINLS